MRYKIDETRLKHAENRSKYEIGSMVSGFHD